MEGKSYTECRGLVTAARFAVMNSRKGPSLLVKWDEWLQAVDAELVKVVPAGNAAKYKQAIETIASSLQ